VDQKWENLLKQTGPYQRQLSSSVKTGSSVDDADLVIVTVEFEKVTDNLIIIFDNQKRVVGIDFPVIEKQ
jgi:hypothetical protein